MAVHVPFQAMVQARQKRAAQAAAERVLGPLEMIEGNIGGIRSFVDTVCSAVLAVRSLHCVCVRACVCVAVWLCGCVWLCVCGCVSHCCPPISARARACT